MIRSVRLTKRARKSLRRVPQSVRDVVDIWRGLVEAHGLEFTQRIAKFRDHALEGKLKKSGVRSVSLSYGYRLFYRLFSGTAECALVEEINNHDYKEIERLFGR
jgi:mRNA-degrading endonuclease YafQ of YafQ-DinJ toxin-antitoxin module